MKKQLSITLLTIVSLAAVLLNLSCGGVPQNNTAVSNAANGSAAPSNTAANSTAQSSPTPVVTDCSGDASGKQKIIKDGIEDNIKKDGKLYSQYTAKKFGFEPVMDANGDAALYIWGSIFTSGKDLDNLNKTYKDFVKKGCVTKVAFTSAPAKIADVSTLEFNLCEAPNQICPDGTCREVCVKKDANTNTNMNSNSNK